MSQVKLRRPPPELPRDGRSERRIKVVIVENHQLVSESLGMLLDGQPDMEVVGKATSVAEAGELPRHLSPDVVVMGFHLADGAGGGAAPRMRRRFPGLGFAFLSRAG